MKVYLICGKARNGKDTTGDIIEKYYEEKGMKVCRTQISKYLKQYIKDYFGWDGSEETKPRELLNRLGTEVIREKLNKPRFFVDRTIDDIDILQHFFDIMIITDVRFPIEIDSLRESCNDVVAIHIKRINFESELSEDQKKNKTETALDNFDKYDYRLINDTLEQLEIDVKKIVDEEEQNEKTN